MSLAMPNALSVMPRVYVNSTPTSIRLRVGILTHHHHKHGAPRFPNHLSSNESALICRDCPAIRLTAVRQQLRAKSTRAPPTIGSAELLFRPKVTSTAPV